MKYLGPLLAGGLTLLIVIIVGVFSFFPASGAKQQNTAPVQAPAQAPVPVVPQVAPVVAQPVVDTAQLEADAADREAIYLGQIKQLEQVLQERQTNYQNQMQQLTDQITKAQNQLNELRKQEQALSNQMSELEKARNDRLTTYQNQLGQTQSQYNAQYAEMQATLNDIRQKLATANAKLGR